MTTRLSNEYETLTVELKKLRPEEQVERYKSISEIRAEMVNPPEGSSKTLGEMETEAAIELIEVLQL